MNEQARVGENRASRKRLSCPSSMLPTNNGRSGTTREEEEEEGGGGGMDREGRCKMSLRYTWTSSS
jgi:hypothetical protein